MVQPARQERSERPLRVLHLGKFYPPTPGGIERTLQAMARESAAAGIDTAVLAHAAPGSWRTREHADGAVRVVEAACPGQLVYAPLSTAFPLQLSRLLREFRPDLLHLHLPNTSAFFALLSPAARRLPWVVHWHADIPLDSGSRALRLAYPLYRPWEQALLRRAAAIIATSPDYRDASAALAPWRSKVSVIPLGLGDLLATPFPTGPAHAAEAFPSTASFATPFEQGIAGGGCSAPVPSPLKLLAVGRLSHYKGFDVLLRALTQVPEASLQLIGSGEEAARLRTLVAELRLQDRVTLAGRVDDAALEAAYAQADAFCLPSLDRAEAFGLVLLEAMRAALPIVASAIPGSGVNHVLRDAALTVPPGDAEALAQALRTLARDAPLRARLGAAGHARWREHFTPATTTPALLDLYRQVAS